MGYRHNRKRFDDWLSRLNPTDFEALIAEYFRNQGNRVEHVGAAVQGRRFDGGIDLKLYKENGYTIVQCKNWKAMQVTHNAIHELLGVMLTQRANAAIVITSGEFTAAAITAAAEEPRMRLIDGVELRRLLATWPGRERWSTKSEVNSLRSAAFGIGAFVDRFASSTSSAVRVRSVVRLAGVMLALGLSSVAVVALVITKPSHTISSATGNRAGGLSIERGDEQDARAYDAIATAATPRDSRSQSGMQQKPAERAARFMTNSLNMADPNGRIDPESARLVLRRIVGVRSVVWMDQTLMIVRVDNAERRSMRMINEVCDALDPLGDTLGVVVGLQNANARNGDEMETLTRNCKLAEGQRALGQHKRQVDTVSPQVRAQFKAMQERNQPKR